MQDKTYINGLFGLVCKGIQDKELSKITTFWDLRELFFNDTYQVIYTKINEQPTCFNNSKDYSYITYKIILNVDLINNINLIIPNKNNESINNIIYSIDSYIGDQKFDSLCSENLEMQINTNCSLFNREKIRNINGLTFIPLIMAPFHDHNLICPINTTYPIKITLKINNLWDYSNISLYGNIYYLDKQRYKIGWNYDFSTIQNKYNGKSLLKKGSNIIKLHFDHPMCLIYFWGFNKSLVTNIKLLLNNHAIYDGPLEQLEYIKYSNGYDIEPAMIQFSDKLVFNKKINSSVNCSRIEMVDLVIETEQDEDNTWIYIAGLNLNIIRHFNNCYGIAYAS